MALRLACKINSKNVQNQVIKRVLSAKQDVAVASVAATNEDTGLLEAAPSQSIQYSVCKPRAAKFGPDLQFKNDTAQHLQPAMLPEYYQPPYQMQVGTYAKDTEESRASAANKGSSRRFEQSKTYANITLPIKAQKLANPFPDPVKMMASHTVSDQEKANQMLAESRMPSGKHHSSGGCGTRALAAPQVRRFSSSSSKKKNKCKSKCKKLKQANCDCPVAKKISCEKKPKFVDCEKIDAPYPAYSESCHEDIIGQDNECTLCPWKPDEHPHFKTKKREMHTSARLHALDKNGCPKPYGGKKPCGYIEKKPVKKNEKCDGCGRPIKPKGGKCSKPILDDEQPLLIAAEVRGFECSRDCGEGHCEKIKSPCRNKCHEWQEEMEAEKKQQEAQEAQKAEEARKARQRKPKKRGDGWGNAWESYAMRNASEQEAIMSDGWVDQPLNLSRGVGLWQPRKVLEQRLDLDGPSTSGGGLQLKNGCDDECPPKKKPCCKKIEKGPCFEDNEEEDDCDDEECTTKTPGTFKCPGNLRKAIRDKIIKDRGGSRQEQLEKYKRIRDKEKQRQKKDRENEECMKGVFVPPHAYEDPVQPEIKN